MILIRMIFLTAYPACNCSLICSAAVGIQLWNSNINVKSINVSSMLFDLLRVSLICICLYCPIAPTNVSLSIIHVHVRAYSTILIDFTKFHLLVTRDTIVTNYCISNSFCAIFLNI